MVCDKFLNVTRIPVVQGNQDFAEQERGGSSKLAASVAEYKLAGPLIAAQGRGRFPMWERPQALTLAANRTGNAGGDDDQHRGDCRADRARDAMG